MYKLKLLNIIYIYTNKTLKDDYTDTNHNTLALRHKCISSLNLKLLEYQLTKIFIPINLIINC